VIINNRSQNNVIIRTAEGQGAYKDTNDKPDIG